MSEQELREKEAELEAFANEIKERERALQIEEHNRSKENEANRFDLFFDATNRHAARPVATVILEPQPTRNEVSRADLVAMAAMILSVGAVAASVVSLLI